MEQQPMWFYTDPSNSNDDTPGNETLTVEPVAPEEDACYSHNTSTSVIVKTEPTSDAVEISQTEPTTVEVDHGHTDTFFPVGRDNRHTGTKEWIVREGSLCPTGDHNVDTDSETEQQQQQQQENVKISQFLFSSVKIKQEPAEDAELESSVDYGPSSDSDKQPDSSMSQNDYSSDYATSGFWLSSPHPGTSTENKTDTFAPEREIETKGSLVTNPAPSQQNGFFRVIKTNKKKFDIGLLLRRSSQTAETRSGQRFYPCRTCGYLFDDEKSRRSHEWTSHVGTVQPPSGDKAFSTPDKESSSTTEKPVPSNSSAMTSGETSEVQSSKAQDEDDEASDSSQEASSQTHTCFHCPRSYKAWWGLRKHMKKAHGISVPKPVTLRVCDYCGAEFCKKKQYKKHMANHELFGDVKLSDITSQEVKPLTPSSVPLYKCPSCPKLCSTSHHLRAHFSTHGLGEDTLQEPGNVTIKAPTEDVSGAAVLDVPKEGDSTKLVQCRLCPRSFKQIDHMVSHMRLHLDSGRGKFICDICDKGFNTRQLLRVHAKRHAENYAQTRKDRTPAFTQCDMCNNLLQNIEAEKTKLAATDEEEDFQKNKLSEMDGTERSILDDSEDEMEVTDSVSLFEASSSGKNNSSPQVAQTSELSMNSGTTSASNYQLETQYTHNFLDGNQLLPQELGDCEFCGVPLMFLKKKQSHMDRHKKHNDKTLAELHELAKLNGTLKRKSPESEGEMKQGHFKCKICSAPFQQMLYLIRHVRRVHNADDSMGPACKICKRPFKSIIKLRRHIEEVHGLKRFQCPHCAKFFIDLITWKTHVDQYHHQRHQQPVEDKRKMEQLAGPEVKVKPPAEEKADLPDFETAKYCSFCNKYFRYSKDRQIHERIHTAEKPFTCDVCGKRFRQRGHVTSHMRTHTGERPYNCQFCSSSFTTSSSRNKHYRYIHYDQLHLRSSQSVSELEKPNL